MKPKRSYRLIWKFALFVLAVYGITLLVLVLKQRSYMYFPNIGSEKEFLARAPKQKLLPWRDESGKLIGWKRETPGAKKRMIILHGNGGDATSRTYFMDGWGNNSGWDFYALEYPGYGSREGSPSEQTILTDADDALKDLQRRDGRPIFISAESLGTGVACILAGKNPKVLQGLFLVTPYTSTSDVAAGRFPFFPVRILMQDRYEATKALQDYSGPVAILLAGNDYIVPTRFGQALFDGYKGPKKLWIQPTAGHNTLDFAPESKLWNEVEQFWQHPTK